MSETSLVLDFLRQNFARVHERFDGIERWMDEVVVRLSAVERDIANLRVDFAGMQNRMDNFDRRLSRMSGGWIWSMGPHHEDTGDHPWPAVGLARVRKELVRGGGRQGPRRRRP